jgi:hypothetical protein
MTHRPSPLERAFELTRSGEYATVAELRKQLRAEGLSDNQIDGPTLNRQLRGLCIAGIAAKVTPDA